MLKKISIRKILLSSVALFAIALIYFIPSNEINVEQKLEYVDKEMEQSNIFLMDKNSFVALTDVPVGEKEIEKKAFELIKILTIGGMDSKVPSGFSAILPPDTEVIDVTYDHGVLKVNFSKEVLDVDKELEEKMIESIIYTLTSIDKVDKIVIYVEGDILTKLPKTKIILPSTLDRSFGINKEFDLTNTKSITDVTVYYINQINDNYYYVPVTKYLNDDRERLDIIIDELSVGFNPNKKLKSYLSEDVSVISKEISDGKIVLDFKENDYNSGVSQNIDKTVVLSICETYKVNSVDLNNNEKDCKNV